MRDHVDLVRDALDAGALGYALKQQSASEVISAIRQVAAGTPYIAPALEAQRARLDARYGGVLDGLSPREREVFDLLVRGYTLRQVASELYISAKTADTHRQHVMRKLEAHKIIDLMRLAVRTGLLT